VAIIVSDASPLFALDHLGRLELLPRYFSDVLLPPAVATELAMARPPRRVIDLSAHPYLRVAQVRDRQVVDDLRLKLDPGESEAIALTLETPGATLLIDEYQGRAIARSRGLEVVGVLGILLRAKLEGDLPSLVGAMERLRAELLFRISDPLFDLLREKAGE
jgi:predicted nucleic acid-binding protein